MDTPSMAHFNRHFHRHFSRSSRTVWLPHALALAGLALACGLAGAQPSAAAAASPRPTALQTVTVTPAASPATWHSEGVVEAVRQAAVAAQVPGAIVQLDVAAGERVRQGQVLMRIDARAAEQTSAASEAQVQAAQAALALATQDLLRQQQLFQQQYISRAALDQAESAHRAAQAQANALLAQAGASRTQSAYHVVRAPFSGVVAQLGVSLGDMAMPGRPLLTLYDPAALRVTLSVPITVARQRGSDSDIRIDLPGTPGTAAPVRPARVQWLPTVDPATHTAQLRADLPAAIVGVAPGMFARVSVPVSTPASASRGDALQPETETLSVPAAAIVRRAELTAVYVLGDGGRPLLRQVRLGRTRGDRVEVLSGLAPGDRVATDPQAAARLR